ncbi:MAG: dTMP kinase [Nitrososphaerota archaeon]
MGKSLMTRGYLIAIEGIDGAGKTVNALWLVRRLRSRGYRAVYTREPTDGPVGRLLRRMIERGSVGPEMDALLFAADRLYHVRRFLEPKLRSGYVVVSDRYLFSSIAYQGALTGDRTWVELLNRHCPMPDLTLYLDVDPSTALRRKKASRLRAFEDVEVLRRVRSVYLELCGEGKMIRIAADGELREVRAEIAKALRERLGIDVMKR